MDHETRGENNGGNGDTKNDPPSCLSRDGLPRPLELPFGARRIDAIGLAVGSSLASEIARQRASYKRNSVSTAWLRISQKPEWVPRRYDGGEGSDLRHLRSFAGQFLTPPSAFKELGLELLPAGGFVMGP
jgi:hypothetical protein